MIAGEGRGHLSQARLQGCIHEKDAQQVPRGPLMVDLNGSLICNLIPAIASMLCPKFPHLVVHIDQLAKEGHSRLKVIVARTQI